MPTSSTSTKYPHQSSQTTSNRRSYWPNASANDKQQSSNYQKRKSNAKLSHIRHISPPSSLTSTSMALQNSMAAVAKHQSAAAASELSLTIENKQPISLGASISGNELYVSSGLNKGKSNYLTSNAQYAPILQQSQSSLQTSAAASTTQLTSSSNTNHNTFSIRRQFNLKYIKTIIIILMSLDLLITVFVHQFSSQDQLTLWFTSYKLRFSLLNLLLTAIWFVILIGAILFDIYFILLISSLVHIASFFLLFGFSIVHFTRRIDYNTVNPTSLLALLFSIVVLHVYLLVLAALTIYLMRAVRRRKSITS